MHKEDGFMLNAASDKKIQFIEQNRLARVLLSHTKRKNAICESMRADLLVQYKKWVEDADIYAIVIESADPTMFASGGDLFEIYEVYEQSLDQAIGLFKQEYETIWAIDTYTKPLISLVNGPVMGGGVGFVQYGTHLIAGESFSWSMPETKIGLFPDIGILHLMAQMPGAIGIYLALTGRSIARDDCYYLQLLEFCIDSDQFETIKRALDEAEPVDPILDGLHQPPQASDLQVMEPVITKVFSQGTMEEIVESLKSIDTEYQVWAQEVLVELDQASPLSLKVTLEAIKRAKSLSFDQTLEQDYVVAQHFLNDSDFIPTIKAKFIDKTSPTFTPHTLEQVSDEMVASFFSPTDAPKLHLPARELGLDK